MGWLFEEYKVKTVIVREKQSDVRRATFSMRADLTYNELLGAIKQYAVIRSETIECIYYVVSGVRYDILPSSVNIETILYYEALPIYVLIKRRD